MFRQTTSKGLALDKLISRLEGNDRLEILNLSTSLTFLAIVVGALILIQMNNDSKQHTCNGKFFLLGRIPQNQGTSS